MLNAQGCPPRRVGGASETWKKPASSSVALLSPDKLNLGVTVFVGIKTSQHSYDWLERFAKAVSEIDEVVEFYRMSGEVDYMMRIVAPDIAGYDAVYKRLIQAADLSDVSSAFAMERIKFTTALPLDYV